MKFLFLLLLTVSLWSQDLPTDRSLVGKPPTIKVLLTHDASSALLEVKGHYQIVDPATDLEITHGSATKRQRISCTANGLDWGEVFPSIHQIRIVPLDAESSILVNGIQYRGCIEVCQAGMQLQIINEVDIESYLKSILTFQFTSPLHDEVLQALAVIARTHAYYTAARNAHAFWHVDARTVGYHGYGITLQNLHLDQAIERTQHVILTFENAPFAATWTENSAGATAPFSSIFRKNAPGPTGVSVPIAAKMREKNSWSLQLPAATLAHALNMPNIQEVHTFSHKQSNKVYALRLKTQDLTNDVNFIDLQKILGPDQLKSSDFTVQLKDGRLLFTGYGAGPGVGLCLYSAAKMAEEGSPAKQILLTFFPDTQVNSKFGVLAKPAPQI